MKPGVCTIISICSSIYFTDTVIRFLWGEGRYSGARYWWLGGLRCVCLALREDRIRYGYDITRTQSETVPVNSPLAQDMSHSVSWSLKCQAAPGILVRDRTWWNKVWQTTSNHSTQVPWNEKTITCKVHAWVNKTWGCLSVWGVAWPLTSNAVLNKVCILDKEFSDKNDWQVHKMHLANAE